MVLHAPFSIDRDQEQKRFCYPRNMLPPAGISTAMLEYVFFHPEPCERFVAFLREHALDPEVREEGETWEVCLPEGLPDDQVERIEARYDELLELNRRLHDEEAPEGEYHAAGVVLDLAGGQRVYARVDPVLLARIMSVLTPEEFGRVVHAIVDAVENPDPRTMCQRMRDSGEG